MFARLLPLLLICFTTHSARASCLLHWFQRSTTTVNASTCNTLLSGQLEMADPQIKEIFSHLSARQNAFTCLQEDRKLMTLLEQRLSDSLQPGEFSMAQVDQIVGDRFLIQMNSVVSLILFKDPVALQAFAQNMRFVKELSIQNPLLAADLIEQFKDMLKSHHERIFINSTSLVKPNWNSKALAADLKKDWQVSLESPAFKIRHLQSEINQLQSMWDDLKSDRGRASGDEAKTLDDQLHQLRDQLKEKRALLRQLLS